MSGTHALDQSPRIINWEAIKEQAADKARRLGGGVLDALANGINRFEVGMTARSLQRHKIGASTLERYIETGVDPRFAHEVEARLVEV